MLERTVGANFAKAAFFEHINDIDVYIEDTSVVTRKVIAILVGRALGGQVRLAKVFPLGGKGAVLDQCAQDQNDVGRRRVFIVDGDFSCWSCFSYMRLRRLFVLPRYCVENFLIDVDAIISTLYEEAPEKDEDEIKLGFAFQAWLNESAPLLVTLFKSYAVAHRLVPEVPTVGRSVREFVKDGVGSVDETKIQSVVEELRNAVDLAHGIGAFDIALHEMEQACAVDNLVHGVSGKDYLLPLMLIRMRSVARIRSSNSSILVRLASKCAVNEIASIAGVIEA